MDQWGGVVRNCPFPYKYHTAYNASGLAVETTDNDKERQKETANEGMRKKGFKKIVIGVLVLQALAVA